MRRIGILCIHGIGDQPRFQHVDKVARDLREHLCSAYGENNVFTEASPGIYNRSLSPSVSFLVAVGPDVICFDLVEMWWRDLGERPGFKRLVRFWWWALTLWTTAGFGDPPAQGRVLPRRDAGTTSLFRVSLKERLRLFFYSLSFFVLLLPLQLVLSVLSLIPFVRRIDVLRSVYAYMSSVKIYEQYKNDTVQDILDYSVPRRIRIQKRAVDEILAMAQSDFEHWLILAHSLGSVIAFKALMYDGTAFARALSFQRWTTLDPQWKADGVVRPAKHVDEPSRPPWMTESESIDLHQVYRRFKGFVTYGSPIETFSTLWPSIVEINTQIDYLKAEWINLYDKRDLISSPIQTMHALADVMPLTNINTNSHWLLIKSHTNYLSKSHELVARLIRWMPSGGTLEEFVGQSGHKGRPSLDVTTIAFQVILILAVGASILPIAIAGVWEALVGVLREIDRLVEDRTLPARFYDRLDAVTKYLGDLRLRVDEHGTLQVAGVIESLVLFALALLLTGLGKRVGRRLMKGLNPSQRRPPR